MEPKLPEMILYREAAAGSTAVIFVHGFTGRAENTWGLFPKLILNDPELVGCDVFSWGYPTEPDLRNIVLKYFWTDNPDLATIANGLRTQLDTRTNDYRRLAFVGHSMGGLVIQAFIIDELLNRRPQHLDRLTEVVLMGTPSGGLVKARWGSLLDAQVRDMSATGEFVQRLRRLWKELIDDQRSTPGALARFRLTLVAGLSDKFVPESSSLDPFPLDEKARIPGNHVEMVKPTDADSLVYRLLKNCLTRRLPTKEEWETIHGRSKEVVQRINRVRVALDLGDVDDLTEHAADLLKQLPAMMPLVDRALGLALLDYERYEPAMMLLRRYLDFQLPSKGEQSFGNDTQAIQQLAIAFSGAGQITEAVACLGKLEPELQSNPETQGILAGRFKRQWLKSQSLPRLGERSRALYEQAFVTAQNDDSKDQAFYNGINAAYMAFALGDVSYSALAEKVRVICEDIKPRDYWAEATLGEAWLLLQNYDEAVKAYDAARRHQGHTPRGWSSTGQQALDILRRQGDPPAGDTVRRLFATIHRDF
jgi:pimeloyl-ACP methyl ester carboxylesterase